ncbi:MULTISPECIES: hypothetical protein [Thermocrispum]|jgi:hypothetical protein|uniref:DUF4149 domain-containing protein n=1 Tax=Thermocrispum agreste TaxID=37925 RepID=A0A2W4JM83_9PSEU|nr:MULTISPECIES: hypothetical protein [Thermocrispum]PZM94877.1 MAG: hypothetical protein DIU77_13365 [Thermocrispum agreste]
MTQLAIAVTFVWLGMVLAISFLEAPLKFRAPGITVPLGLGIGRIVFRALNTVEVVLAVVLVVAAIVAGITGLELALGVVVIAILAVQLLGVRPRLTRRSDQVLSGKSDGSQRSRTHYVYVAFEVAKVAGLIALGAALLA